MSVFVVEVDGANNESLRFAPVMRTLRGSWAASRVAQNDMNDAMKSISTVPKIPGMRIKIDTSERSAIIYDPLAETEEGRQIWEKLLPKLKDHEPFFGAIQRPCKSFVVRNMSDNDLKTWMYHLRLGSEAGLLQPAEGSPPLPAMDAIKSQTGGIRVSLMASNVNALPEAERYRDVVEAKSESKPEKGQTVTAAK